MRRFITALIALTIAGCQSMPETPLDTVDQVDLPRFMGDWYVIAHIPLGPEKNAYNAVESYALNGDGTIATTYTFRKGGFDGAKKSYEAKGFVKADSGNAVWGMQFLWPFKADYRVAYLNDDYSQTVIGRKQRDYVWIMARTPDIPEGDLSRLERFVEAQGYDTNKLRVVPQRWTSPL